MATPEVFDKTELSVGCSGALLRAPKPQLYEKVGLSIAELSSVPSILAALHLSRSIIGQKFGGKETPAHDAAVRTMFQLLYAGFAERIELIKSRIPADVLPWIGTIGAPITLPVDMKILRAIWPAQPDEDWMN